MGLSFLVELVDHKADYAGQIHENPKHYHLKNPKIHDFGGYSVVRTQIRQWLLTLYFGYFFELDDSILTRKVSRQSRDLREYVCFPCLNSL